MNRLIIVVFLMFATGSAADTPKVVTDIAPVHSLVSQVMQGVGAPEILLDQGADAHSFQLRPSQVRRLSGAELLFWVGPDLTPWLARAISGVGVAGKSIPLLRAEQTTDPHGWLDPQNALVWLDMIAGELAAADPANAARYRSNAAAAKTRIEILEREVGALLAPMRPIPLIVFHDAYGHFAERFQMNIIGAIRQSDATPPSAAHLAELRDMVSTRAEICIFGDVGEDPALLQAVIAGRDITIGWLDPMGAGQKPGPELYDALIRTMADEIASCLSD